MEKNSYLKIVQKYGEKYNFDWEEFSIEMDESNFDSEDELRSYLAKHVKFGNLPGMAGNNEGEEITDQMCRGYSPFYGCKLKTHDIDGNFIDE